MVTGLILLLISLLFFQIDKLSEYLINYNLLSSKIIIDSISKKEYIQLLRWFVSHLSHLNLQDYLISSISLMSQGLVLEKYFNKISKFFFLKLVFLMMILTSFIFTFLSFFMFKLFEFENYYIVSVCGLSSILLGLQYIYYYLTTRNFYSSFLRVFIYIMYFYFIIDSSKLLYHISGIMSGMSIVYLIDF
tara:strand:+ start:3464 stop:4033 length:570 start_codon:yes stop_codon:yes gene_type:complete